MPVEEATGELESMMQLAGLGSGPAQLPEVEKGLSVRFLYDTVENEQKSKLAGRPIYDEVEICEIRIVGSQDMTRDQVTDQHKGRFPRLYAAFKADKDQDVVSGTPLKEWPILRSAQREELRWFGIRTVEQLAQVSDGNLQRLGAGWGVVRQQARDYLDKADKGAVLARLRAELDERDRRLTALETMLAQQKQALHAAGLTPGVPQVQDGALAALQAQVAQLANALASNALQTVPAKPKRTYSRKPKNDPPSEA